MNTLVRMEGRMICYGILMADAILGDYGDMAHVKKWAHRYSALKHGYLRVLCNEKLYRLATKKGGD